MKIFRQLLIVAVMLGVAQASWAQSYPNKAVRIIVPFGAGSGSDVGIRVLAEAISRSAGQTFLVENRPGASGNLGMAAGAKAAPDGYTLVTGGLGVNVMNQFLFPAEQMGFDPIKDLEPIVLMAKLPFMIAVSPSFAPNNVPELIAAIKAKPGSVTVAVTQSTSRMLVELFGNTTGAALYPVAYKAAGTAMTDVIGGTVTVAMETIAALRAHVNAGRVKAIAVTSRKTSELLPNVKSVAEQGVADFEFVGWVSLYGPRGMPREAVNFLNAELNKALRLQDTRKRFLDLGFEASGGTPQDLTAFENSERRRWGPVIKSANITAN